MTMEVRAKTEEEPDDDGKCIVRGYATTFNHPYELYSREDYTVMEQVDKNAFKKCNMSDVIFQYDHAGRVFARKSNGTLELTEDDHGLMVEADLGGTQIGRGLYEEIKGGYTTKMSFGFTVNNDTRSEYTENGKRVILRTITDIDKLYDVSAVSLPANDFTEISARCYSDGVIAEAETERLKAEQRAKEIAKLKLKLRLMEV